MRIAGLLALGLMLGGCAKSVDDWRRDLHDEDPYARLMAVVALGETGRSDVAPDLLAALSDTSETVRAAALESLRALGPAAAPALLQRLELGATTPADEDPARQARLVASVLVDQGLTSSAPLIQALQDDRYDRQAIVEALAAAGPSIVGPLGELLLQPQPGVAAAAASALGSLGEQALSSVTSLVLALRRPEPEVTRAAAGALGRIAPDRSDVLPALLQVARAPGADDDSERAAAIAEARRAAVRGLLLRMASGQPPLQEQALAQMADLGPIAIEGLIHALKFDDDAVADEAADCLATLGPGVLPSLLSSLGERNPRHIERGAQVVARIGPPALEPLLAIIAEPEHRDRVRATTALAGLGAGAGPAWPALLALLDDPSPKMPLAAALTLGRLTPPDDASLDALLAAHARQSAMVSRLLLPALVRGLVLRIAPGTPDGAARLDQLRGLGPDAVGELGRLRDDPDPGLSAAAGRVAALLASP